jgi:hypothetical protein
MAHSHSGSFYFQLPDSPFGVRHWFFIVTSAAKFSSFAVFPNLSGDSLRRSVRAIVSPSILGFPVRRTSTKYRIGVGIVFTDTH